MLVAFVASGVALILRSGIYLTYGTCNETFVHLADQALQQQARPDDLLLMEVLDLNAFYQGVLHVPREVFASGSGPDLAARQVAGHERVWLLANEAHRAIERSLAEAMHIYKSAVHRKDLKLTLFATNEADCT